MSTLADELLQDFEDSGSEGEGLIDQTAQESFALKPVTNGKRRKANYTDHDGDIILDDDEEAVGEADEELNGNGLMADSLSGDDDEEAAKAKVERMQFAGVDDVRSVAGLMKTLEPVLEVSLNPICCTSRPSKIHINSYSV